jgi:hypothetical protein
LRPRGYREDELVVNRASLLLAGGTEEERRIWAAVAARNFSHEGPLVEVRQEAQVAEALRRAGGVVFFPDVTRLGSQSQALLVRCLQTQEERPKLVVGLSVPVEEARSAGTLREDLLYRLHLARVDLGDAAVRETFAQRRAVYEADEAARRAEEEKAAAEKAARLKATSRRTAGRSRLQSKELPRAASARQVTRREPQ